MTWRFACLAGAIIFATLPAMAASEFGTVHPEEAYPDEAPPLASRGPYADLLTQVQEKLHALDFDAGPVNGESTSKLQAALAQFQLSRALPVSGMLDEQTLRELGVPPLSLESAEQPAEPQQGEAGDQRVRPSPSPTPGARTP
jgi:peptidoglycan hydrolase-like protein with peptidoglycan-binding domain